MRTQSILFQVLSDLRTISHPKDRGSLCLRGALLDRDFFRLNLLRLSCVQQISPGNVLSVVIPEGFVLQVMRVSLTKVQGAYILEEIQDTNLDVVTRLCNLRLLQGSCTERL